MEECGRVREGGEYRAEERHQLNMFPVKFTE